MPIIVSKAPEDVSVLGCSGVFVLGGQTLDLRDAIRDIAAKDGTRGLVIDLTKVTKLDAAGVGELAAGLTTCTNQSVRFAICGATGVVAEILELVWLTKALQNHCGPEAAIAAMK